MIGLAAKGTECYRPIFRPSSWLSRVGFWRAELSWAALSDNQMLRRTPPGQSGNHWQSARWQLGDRAAVTFDLVALLWQHRLWWLVPCLVSLLILGALLVLQATPLGPLLYPLI